MKRFYATLGERSPCISLIALVALHSPERDKGRGSQFRLLQYKNLLTLRTQDQLLSLAFCLKQVKVDGTVSQGWLACGVSMQQIGYLYLRGEDQRWWRRGRE